VTSASSAATTNAVAPSSSSAATTNAVTPSSSSGATPSSTTIAALAPLPPELVGSWTTATWQSQSGYPQIRRTYVFSADGRYEYTVGQCESSTQCALVSKESGTAQVEHGVLAVVPQSESADGPRSWPYAVDRDPVVGDVRLNLALAGGQTDIFYRD
jgi:hypothetical protein